MRPARPPATSPAARADRSPAATASRCLEWGSWPLSFASVACIRTGCGVVRQRQFGCLLRRFPRKAAGIEYTTHDAVKGFIACASVDFAAAEKQRVANDGDIG